MLNKKINFKMKKSEIKDWDTAIDYVISHALKNINKYTFNSVDDVMDCDYNVTSLYMSVLDYWSSSDNFHNLVIENTTHFIRVTEYIIVRNTDFDI